MPRGDRYNARMSLDVIMEKASDTLARMDYLACEALCEQALAQARAAQDWAYYGRILLPLQESRRQRRMIAAEGAVRLGTRDLTGDAESWLAQFDAGCLVVTQPNGRHDAARLHEHARRSRRWVEVLFADSQTDEPFWTVRTFSGPAASCRVPAPRPDWRNAWLTPKTTSPQARASGSTPAGANSASATPADWFLDAAEKLGDAMIASVTSSDPRQRIAALEQCLFALPSHELLHQRLGDAARAACLIRESASA